MLFPTTNTTLIKQLSSDELREVAWKTFFSEYKEAILDIASFKGLTDYEAKEVLQNVMLKFYKCIEKDFLYDISMARFRTFLERIIKSCIYDQFRLRKKDIHITCELYDENSPDKLFDIIFMEKWRNFIKEQAIKELKDNVDSRTFQIFDLYVIKNTPPQEVASLFNCSCSNVYTIKSRCIERLQNIVKNINNDDKGLLLDV